MLKGAGVTKLDFVLLSLFAWGVSLSGPALWTGALATAMTYAPFAHASDLTPSNPAPSSVNLSQFNSICKDILANPSQSQNNQKLAHCQASKTAKDAADAQGSIWKVWAAVGTVCTAACVSSLALDMTNAYVCPTFNLAAGIADAVITKNYASALMAIGGAGASALMNPALRDSAEEVAEGTVKAKPKPAPKDIGSCLVAASAVFQAFSQNQSMKASQSTAQIELAAAQNSESSGASAQANMAFATANTATGSLGSTPGVSSLGSFSNLTGTTGKSINSICGVASTMPSAGAVVQCALASDPRLPPAVGTQPFVNDFKKASKMDLAEFLAKTDSPGKAMMAAMGGSIPADQGSQLSAALQTMEQQVPIEIASTVYGGGGAGGADGAGGDGGDFAQGLAGMMSQFFPNGGQGAESKSGLALVVFANKHYGPGAIAENPTLSIFDRVTFRYFILSRKLLAAGGATP